MAKTDIVTRAEALAHAERKLRRRAMLIPAVCIGICLMLFLVVGWLYVRDQRTLDRTLKERNDALEQIALVNANREAMLAQLEDRTLSRAQISVILDQIEAATAQTRTIAVRGAPGKPGPMGPPGLPGKDSTVPGPVGPMSTITPSPGARGAAGRDGRDSTVPGPMSTVTPSPGAKGDKGDPGDCPQWDPHPTRPGYEICTRPSPTPTPAP